MAQRPHRARPDRGPMDTMTLHRDAAPGHSAGPDLPRETTPPTGTPTTPSRIQRLWRGPEGDPSWARPALLGLLLATALFYFYNLTANGYANSFYSAAVQAGSDSWKAFFFGSSDAGQLDHGRQAAGLAVGDGPVGAGLRAELVRILHARGAHGGRHGRRRLRDGEAPLRRRRRPASAGS